MPRRGDWNQDEVTLALSLYLQFRDNTKSGDEPIRTLAGSLDREFGDAEAMVRSFAWDDPKRPWRPFSSLTEEARRLWATYNNAPAELAKKVKEIEAKLKPAART